MIRSVLCLMLALAAADGTAGESAATPADTAPTEAGLSGLPDVTPPQTALVPAPTPQEPPATTVVTPIPAPEPIQAQPLPAPSVPRPGEANDQPAETIVDVVPPTGEEMPQETVTGVVPLDMPAGQAADIRLGEQARLEAEKQKLQLKLEIATLRKKIDDIQSGPMGGLVPADKLPAPAPRKESPPRVITRSGFDGRYAATLQFATGGQLSVQPGDPLPHGKVEMIDDQGVTAIWYGKRIRLFDVAPASAGGGLDGAIDLTLPVPPAGVTEQ